MGSDKETLFKTIFEQSPIGLAVVTINGRILEMNPAMMEITKDELNDLDDVVVTDRYVNPEDKEKIFHLIEKNGSVKEKDLKLLDKNGEPYWAQVSITPITYNGKEAHLVSQIDITEKKRMHFRLQEKDFRIQESSIVSMISTIFIQNSRSFMEKILRSIKIFGNALKAECISILQVRKFKGLESTQGKTRSVRDTPSLEIYAHWEKRAENTNDLSYEKHLELENLYGQIVRDYLKNIPSNFFKLVNPSEDALLSSEKKSFLKRSGVKNLLLLPIFVPGKKKAERLFGVLVVRNHEHSDQYPRNEVHLALEVSIILGLAIKNQFQEESLSILFRNFSEMNIACFIFYPPVYGESFQKVFSNGYFNKIFKKPVDRAVQARDFKQLINEEDAEYLMMLFKERMKGSQHPTKYKIRVKTPNGEKPFQIRTVQSVFNSKSAVFGTLTLINDQELNSPKEIAKKFKFC